MSAGAQAPAPAAPGYRASIAIAVALLVLDILVFQGFLVAFCTAYVVLWSVPQALAAWRRPEARRAWFIRSTAYGCAGLAMAGIVMLNRALAVQGAEDIVAAVENFRAAENRYPKELEELVPRYLDRLPRGDVRPWGSIYRYWDVDEARFLSYTKPPWPVRHIYDFRKRQWRYDD